MNSSFWTPLLVVLIVGFVGLYVGMSMPKTSAKSMQQSMAMAPSTDAEKIANAKMAAPAYITDAATVMDFPSGSSTNLRMLQEGTNEWTCLPDDANSPGVDPICVDKVALQWFGAYMTHETPAITENGYGYMLLGGSTADNDDPYASAPPSGQEWMHEPPHVMVFSAKAPDTRTYGTTMGKGPWVMWPNSPYAHLMVPVE